MTTWGGLIYPGKTLEPPPQFTLYANGLVIYSRTTSGPGFSSLDIAQARLTPGQVTTLVRDALDSGRLREARPEYLEAGIFDVGTTTFEVHADGLDKAVSVYALGFDDGVPLGDLGDRQALAALGERLTAIAGDVAAGRVEDLGDFEPQAYLFTLDQPLSQMTATREWPWPTIEPGFFRPTGDGNRTMVLSAADAKLFCDPPTSVPDDQVLAGPDGEEYLVRLKPLLPDEVPAGFPVASATPSATASQTATASPGPVSIAPVLRLTVHEFPTAVTKIETPEFTLYADGRVIYTVKSRRPNSSWPTYELHSAQLSPEQAEALIAYALEDGGLRDARPEYDVPGSDMGMELEWNHFHTWLDGDFKEVRVYGIGQVGSPDAAERAKFADLASRLLNVPAEIEAGRATYVGTFQPTAYDAFLHSRSAGELPINAEWPWPTVQPSDFNSFPDGTLTRRLTRAEGEAVLGLGIDEYLIAEAPDGERYMIRVQPLLPDEAAGPILE